MVRIITKKRQIGGKIAEKKKMDTVTVSKT